jgi:dTDP-4-amino-4,6-dideoxygalactose transaminase
MQVPLIDLQAQYATIREEIGRAIERVLTRQKFILDTEVEGLEAEIAAECGTGFAIGCASGTDALLLSLLGLDLKEGDEVITTGYSFFSTASMIAWLKAKPVFVDVDPDTFNMNTADVRRCITARTRAIIAVHLFGQCCEIEELKANGLPVIEDAAQAIGSLRDEKPAGSFGITGCFSFFPTKNLGGYGDGGMISTNDEELAARLKMLRTHGQGVRQYLHPLLGTNSRLDELQAAVLRVKLKHLADWNRKRNENAAHYRRELADLPLQLPVIDSRNVSNYHQFVIKTRERDRLKAALTEKGIGTAVYYPVPIPYQPCFDTLGYKPGAFPNAESCAATSLALPVYPELTQPQLEAVTSAIRSFYQ